MGISATFSRLRRALFAPRSGKHRVPHVKAPRGAVKLAPAVSICQDAPPRTPRASSKSPTVVVRVAAE